MSTVVVILLTSFHIVTMLFSHQNIAKKLQENTLYFIHTHIHIYMCIYSGLCIHLFWVNGFIVD